MNLAINSMEKIQFGSVLQKFVKSERFIAILMIVFAVILNAAPYVYQHYFHTPPAGKVYIGSYPIVEDKPVYLAEMIQGQEGNWKLTDKYTTEPQQGTYIYTFYILLGHISRILDLSLETIFFMSRFIFGTLLLIMSIYFIRRFVEDRDQRVFAYFFAFFASGLGWLTTNIKSPDLWIPDAIPMVRFSYFPHITFANTLMLAILFLIYRSFTKNETKPAIIAGILTFILNFILTFHSILIYIITLFFAATTSLKDKSFIRKNLRSVLLFFVISLPSLIYMYSLGKFDPIWSAIEKQNVVVSPSALSLASGYGLILIFSIFGINVLLKKNKLKGTFFALWIIAVLALSHIPTSIYPMQRRFLETAFFVPLAITASYGIAGIYEYLKNRKIAFPELKFNMIFIIFIVPFLLMSNIQNLIHFNYFISEPSGSDYYLSEENIEAIKWLKDNSAPENIVLGSFFNSNVVPYYADQFVYAGHAPLTLNYEEKLKKVDNFYSGTLSSEEIYKFLKEERINYILYTDEEKKLGKFDPEKYGFLKKAYQNKGAEIYEFNLTNNSI